MSTITITELRDDLATAFERVRDGERIEVKRGKGKNPQLVTLISSVELALIEGRQGAKPRGAKC